MPRTLLGHDIILPAKKSKNTAFHIQTQFLIEGLQQEEQGLGVLDVAYSF